MVTEPTARTADDVTASWFLGSLVTTRITSEDTDGAVSVLEHLLPPTYETPYHIHHNEDELSYILEGEITLGTERGTVTANGRGDADRAARTGARLPDDERRSGQTTGVSRSRRLRGLLSRGRQACRNPDTPRIVGVGSRTTGSDRVRLRR